MTTAGIRTAAAHVAGAGNTTAGHHETPVDIVDVQPHFMRDLHMRIGKDDLLRDRRVVKHLDRFRRGDIRDQVRRRVHQREQFLQRLDTAARIRIDPEQIVFRR